MVKTGERMNRHMKTVRKTLTFLLLLCLALALLPLQAYAETDGDLVKDSFGDFSSTYNKSFHTLIVHGSGAIPAFSDASAAPWDEYRGELTRIILDEGITALPADCFAECKSLSSVTFPKSLESVDANAFRDCNTVSYISIEGSTTALAEMLKENACFKGAEKVRLNKTSVPAEIGALEKPWAPEDLYYPNPDKKTLDQVRAELGQKLIEEAIARSKAQESSTP